MLAKNGNGGGLMNNILANIKERNMDISLNDVKFFMAYDGKGNCFIAPVLISKDSTKAKDLRTNQVYNIKEDNGSKDVGGLFLSVMQNYDNKMGNNFATNNFLKNYYAQETYTYDQFFRKFYKDPYIDTSINPPSRFDGFPTKFFKEYHISLTEYFITKRKNVVKLCDSIQHIEEKIMKKQNNRQKQKNKSENNREFQ